MAGDNACGEVINFVEGIINEVKKIVTAAEKWVEKEACSITKMGLGLAAKGLDKVLDLVPGLGEALIAMQENPMCVGQTFKEITIKSVTKKISYDNLISMVTQLLCKLPSVPELSSVSSDLEKVCHVAQQGGNIAHGIMAMACGDFATGLWDMLQIPIMCDIDLGPNGESCGVLDNYNCKAYF
eukprot:Pgem_evm1s13333